MSKNNFLLVDLNEEKTKKLAETITSATSRNILNHLAEKEDTEANIATKLNLPISTVHYHLHKLMEASLVKVEEFHYSPKGREVNHYKLANKYIIIAPSNVSNKGLKEKLKSILPVALIVLGISAIIKFTTSFITKGVMGSTAGVKEMALAEKALDIAVPKAAELTAESVSSAPDLALWFLLGGFTAIVVYLLVNLVREYWKK